MQTIKFKLQLLDDIISIAVSSTQSTLWVHRFISNGFDEGEALLSGYLANHLNCVPDTAQTCV